MTNKERELDFLTLHYLLQKVFGDGFEDLLACLLEQTREKRIEMIKSLSDLVDAEEHLKPIIEQMKKDGVLNDQSLSHHRIDAKSMGWLENKTHIEGEDDDSK